MKIALAGASGNFGRLASELFTQVGHTVTGINRGNWGSTDFSDFDLCFLSVPVAEVGKYLQKCGHCTAVEISSVKTPIKRYGGRVISIHPIFGPRSAGNPDFRNIVYVDDISPESGEETIRKLFPGFNIVHMTADAHDRAMVEVLVKPFFLSRIAAGSTGDDLGFTGPSQAILQELAAISGSESSGVLMDTIRLNPFAREAIRQIEKVTRKLAEELDPPETH